MRALDRATVPPSRSKQILRPPIHLLSYHFILKRRRTTLVRVVNKQTGNRIRYRKVDAETGDEVDSADIIKGYEVGKGQYIEIQPEELEAIAIESKRTIEIDEFVPKKEIDELYLNSPYYLVPEATWVNRRLRSFAKQSARKEWWRSGGLFSPRVSTSSRLNHVARVSSV